MKKVEIYTRSWCAYCRMAKAMLNQETISFEEIEISDDPELEEQMIKRSGRTSVPQIFIDDNAIGGFTDLVALSEKVDLRELVDGKSE
ncbi:MAG: glutaredoxin 3 [Gammaproteobacteria bacterium]|nr:glutaredoxin 3 [Gammaproteobacteria bacterium]